MYILYRISNYTNRMHALQKQKSDLGGITSSTTDCYVKKYKSDGRYCEITCIIPDVYYIIA